MQTIWIFIKMLVLWVALPAAAIYLIFKLFFLVFNKLGNRFYDKRKDRKKENQLESIMKKAHDEDERKFISYFIRHDEEVWSDMDYSRELEELWNQGEDDLQTPEENGKRLSMAFDERMRLTDLENSSFLRRKPDGTIVPSRSMRLSVFFGSEKMYIRTLTIDMMKHSAKEETTEYRYDEILDVSFQRLHPLQYINGDEKRVLASTLSILSKGGKRRTWKGMDYDTEEVVKLIKDELELRKGL